MKVNQNRIKATMDRLFMTQGDLSKAASISRATVNVTLQRGSCSFSTAKRIAAALGLNPTEIMVEGDE